MMGLFGDTENVDLNAVAKMLEEFDEVGLEFLGESSGLYIQGIASGFRIRTEQSLWDYGEGSDWCDKSGFEVNTLDDLKIAIANEMKSDAGKLEFMANKVLMDAGWEEPKEKQDGTAPEA